MKFLVLGAGGMAGHVVTIHLAERGHSVTALSRNPFPWGACQSIQGDIKDASFLGGVLAAGCYDAVVNCVGVLNQDAERDRSLAVRLNSLLPHALEDMTRGTGTKVIQISTDCVFSGATGGYHEGAHRDGAAFYDRSKALGELENDKDLTFRTSLVGPDVNPNGIGLFNWFMRQSGSIKGYSRAIWTGVTTDVLAQAVEQAVECGLTGLYHLVNAAPISKFDLLGLFNEHFRNGEVNITPEPSVSVDKSLVNNRRDFPFAVPSYREMVEGMKRWVSAHAPLYPHYSLCGTERE